MLRRSSCRLSHFQSYRLNPGFYFETPQTSSITRMHPRALSMPKIDEKLRRRDYADQKIDLTEKEHIELSEAMRGVRELDFYQDHTWHNEWMQRDLTASQAKQLKEGYGYLLPGTAISPWIWHAGDMVEVVSGQFAGQRGAFVTVIKFKAQVMVQGVNVKPIVIPASDSRPEQEMQREHPISVRDIKHVDPSTNEVCDVRVIKVRDRESGKVEERRVSLQSGVVLPVPKGSAATNVVYEGDPLHDTPLQDAEEDTYDEAAELPVIVERKLKALEDHLVAQLRAAHDFHREHEAENAAQMAQYQRDVVVRTKELLAQRLAADEGLLASWAAGLEDPAAGGDEDAAKKAATE
jgi:large subunit ribosomal protein L24